MLSKWSSDDDVKFLDVCEKSEGLWNNWHSDYNNQTKRDSAMLKLMGEQFKKECGCWKCGGSAKEDNNFVNSVFPHCPKVTGK
jgi:hypothetical protein